MDTTEVLFSHLEQAHRTAEMKGRNATYNLDEATELTGRSREELQQAIEAGDLAIAETGPHGEAHITGTELERWYRGLEGGEKDLFAD